MSAESDFVSDLLSDCVGFGRLPVDGGTHPGEPIVGKVYRGKLPKPDARGYLRPEVGGHKFTLGHVRDISQGEAYRRLDAIRDLYERQCRHGEIDYWSASVLPWAKKLAAGERLVFSVTPYAQRNAGQAAEEAVNVEWLKSIGVGVLANDPVTIAQGERRIKDWIDAEVQQAVTKAVAEANSRWQKAIPEPLYERVRNDGPADPANLEIKTLHDALRAYRSHVEKTGKRQDNGDLAPSPKNYIRWAKLLERSHEDIPLWQLDRNKLDSFFAYWRNRPLSGATNERISVDHAEHLMDCLWAVCVWIDESSEFKWSLPTGAKRISRVPISLDCDRKKNRTRRISKSIYAPAQLATIARHLDRFGKLILGVSVNCAMQAAEIGRLEIHDFYIVHPETGIKANWIVFDRPKTHEYGEWLLWDEVAELVVWGIERAKRIGADRLIVSDDGSPWYREDWANPHVRFAKWWQAKPTPGDHRKGVITKVREEFPEFPRHTMKYLRKILPNMVRPDYGKEVADLVNARHIDGAGRAEANDTDRYADRIYDKMAHAIQELEPVFRPFLDALKSGDD